MMLHQVPLSVLLPQQRPRHTTHSKPCPPPRVSSRGVSARPSSRRQQRLALGSVARPGLAGHTGLLCAPTHTNASSVDAQTAPKPEPSPQFQQAPDGGNMLTSVPQMWAHLAQRHPDVLALSEPHNKEAVNLTYQECESVILQAGAGLTSLGLERTKAIALFAEASSRWILADQAAMTAGGVTVVRGSTATTDELSYILQNGKCEALMIQDADALRKVLPALQDGKVGPLKFIIVIWGSVDESLQSAVASAAAVKAGQQNGSGQHPVLLTWTQLLERGRSSMSQQPFMPAPCNPSEVATLVYTSGTTGQPTGVKLTHGNLAYQVNNLHHFLELNPGDKMLSLLPPWHIYQRTVSYYVHSKASSIIFSNIRRFAGDLTSVTPDHLVCVPLVLDTLHSRVMQKFRSAPALRQKLVSFFLTVSTAYIRARRVKEGRALTYALQPRPLQALLSAILICTLLRPLHELATKLVWSKVREALGVRRTIISGGGSLATHLDDFFEVIDLPVLNGWGLTETSPVLACRKANQNVRGTVGHPVPGTELRIVNPDTFESVPPGEVGQVLARGPGVTPGYQDNEAATAKAFRVGDGWFDTGDLGWQIPYGVPGSDMGGMIQLTGRSKDTIVLINGKNISPQPIEDMICASTLVKHCLLFGQDKRELGALVFPDMDALEALLEQRQTGSSPTPSPPQSSSSDRNGTPPSPSSSSSNGTGAPSSSASSTSSVNGASSGGNGVSGSGAGASSNGVGAASHPRVRAASHQELEELYLHEITRLSEESGHSEPHVARVVVVTAGVLSPDDGTLTQTMKPRKQVIAKKYAAQVETLMNQLRG